MTVPMAQWERLFVGPEATPGTYDTDNEITLPVVRGSGRAREISGSPLHANDAQGRAATRAAVATGRAYIERPISAYAQFTVDADTPPPQGLLFRAAGLDETISEGTSVVYTLPAGYPTAFGLSMREEVALANDTRGQGMRLAGLEIVWSDGSPLLVNGTLRGLKVGARAANSSLTTIVDSAGAWIYRLDTASNPFSIGGFALDVVSWRLSIASEVAMAMAANVAFGYGGVGLSFGRPVVTLEAVVIETDETTHAVEAAVAAGTVAADDVITLTDGTRHQTITLRDGVLEEVAPQAGEPSTRTLRCHYHYDGTNQPVSIAYT